MTRPLSEAAAVADRVAQGDLSVEVVVNGRDESAALLHSLRSMARQLSTMVCSVQSAVGSIALASEEISQGNLDLSDRTERQAASLQKTAVSLSDLVSTVSRNAEDAESACSLAESTASSARICGSAMTQVIETMNGIKESSQRIVDIIEVIDGIAFQTNILALNAAVEAARAGEQGRGFAVVAGEVRALAQRVTGAAGEVRTLITESADRIDNGSHQVGAMSEALAQLVKFSADVKGLVEGISLSSVSQRQSIESVDTDLRDVDTATQQNAALVEQVSAAAHNLAGQTQTLDEMVRRFCVAKEVVEDVESEREFKRN